ncbi:hypothetical protein NKH85_17000 [Mesorhizobium sp. M0924]|uniref:hypothetical protein n=1 Tax=unclassified Mesorhizobium TaxID=325217 RepID=UPI003335952D
MTRTTTIIVFVFSMVLVGGGGFLVGNALVSTPARTGVAAQSILEEAKQRVPEPALPPKPAGREEKVLVPITHSIQVPKIEYQIIKMPFGSNVKIPHTTFETQVVTENVEKTTIVDAAPEEKAAWDAEVKKLQADYNKRLDEEIKKITNEQSRKDLIETTAIIKDMINGAIIPLITALVGLIGAFLALKKAFESPPAPVNPPS